MVVAQMIKSKAASSEKLFVDTLTNLKARIVMRISKMTDKMITEVLSCCRCVELLLS